MKGVWELDPFFFIDVHLAIGAVTYEEVDAVLTLSGVPSTVEVFEHSTRAVFDMGFRGGWRGEALYAEIGVGFRVQGSPDIGDDLDLHAESPGIVALEFGVGVRF